MIIEKYVCRRQWTVRSENPRVVCSTWFILVAKQLSSVEHVLITCTSCKQLSSVEHVLITCTSCKQLSSIEHVLITCTSCKQLSSVEHVLITCTSCKQLSSVEHVLITCTSCKQLSSIEHVLITCTSCIQLSSVEQVLIACTSCKKVYFMVIEHMHENRVCRRLTRCVCCLLQRLSNTLSIYMYVYAQANLGDSYCTLRVVFIKHNGVVWFIF